MGSSGVTSQADRVANNILGFAEKHKLHIHPGRDVKKWAQLVIKNSDVPAVPLGKAVALVSMYYRI